jgi:D-arabinose 1-dehydrogenase-like Zn-dependent alcohol dehydrogenase
MDCTQQGFVVAGSSASLQSIPVPTPKEGEAVVRVLIAGVCNTDLEIMKGATRS